MTRTRIALTGTTLGLTAMLALTGCGAGAAPAVADEAYALTAVGLEAGPAPTASAPATAGAAKEKGRHAGVRKYLRKNTMHGEVTVQGKDGVRTIVVQRGTVTAVDATTVSLKSTDGFTLTWTFGDKVRVRQNKKTVERTAIKTGAEIGVAGAEDGGKTVARLAVIQD